MFTTMARNFPSAGSVFQSYTTVAASAMVAQTVLREFRRLANQLIPAPISEKIIDLLADLINISTSRNMMTITIRKYAGVSHNQVFDLSETYLRTKISPSNTDLEVSKTTRDDHMIVSIDSVDEKVVDFFDGIKVVWWLTANVNSIAIGKGGPVRSMEMTSSDWSIFHLKFNKSFKDKVLGFYLPHVMERGKALKEEKTRVKLFSVGGIGDPTGQSGMWSSVDFDHPATFETLAMDSEMKKMVMDDLDTFSQRKEFYKRVGKLWKRGYLLYGPPGTGKSSLVAAMANHLKFNVYDLQLSFLRSIGGDLRRVLVNTTNKSIIVIEDIDCTVDLDNRVHASLLSTKKDKKLTLSALLNFADGLWSGCGDEKILVFTTNYKEKLDPALLRPGRMDMHIHMSYLTPCGFRTLAFNYLKIKDHRLFREIDKMLMELEVTPADVAEKLMRSNNADGALEGLAEFLRSEKEKKSKKFNEIVSSTGNQDNMEVEDHTKKRKKDRKNHENSNLTTITTRRCKRRTRDAAKVLEVGDQCQDTGVVECKSI